MGATVIGTATKSDNGAAAISKYLAENGQEQVT